MNDPEHRIFVQDEHEITTHEPNQGDRCNRERSTKLLRLACMPLNPARLT